MPPRPRRHSRRPGSSPASSVWSCSGYSRPEVRHALGRPAEREERQELARVAVEHPLAADDVHERVADERVELDLLVALRAEQEKRPREGGRGGRRRSRRRGRAARRVRAPRRARARGRSRPSGQGARRRGPRPLRAAASASGETESRSPITTSTSSPSESARSRPPSAATTAGAAGTATTGPGPEATTTTSGSITRSSAGITQVRFCGSAARQPPSQPGRPSSPVRWANPRPPTLRHAEPAPADGRALLHGDGIDARLRRSVGKPPDENVDVLGVALQLCLDRAVGAVVDPSPDAQLLRTLPGAFPEPAAWTRPRRGCDGGPRSSARVVR